MKKLLLKSLSLTGVALIACSCAPKAAHYEYEKYCAGSLELKERFTICQLNDIHLSTLTDIDAQFDYITKIIRSRTRLNDGNTYDDPDLLVLTGDTFMDATRSIVDDWLTRLDSLKIPYCFTYGNHDLQGSYPSNYVDDTLLKHKYDGEGKFAFYVDVKDDDVYGRSNYYVNLTDSGNIAYQVYILDSNTYSGFEYDIIHDDQVEWYKRCVRGSNGLGENDPIKENMIKSFMFFHIPTNEFQKAIEEHSNGEIPYLYTEHPELDLDYINIQEKVCCPDKDDNLFEAVQEMKSTVSIGVGHDHINSLDVHYQGEGDWPVRMIYGLKSSDGIYHDAAAMGATFYELQDTPYTVTTADGTKTYSEYFDLKMLAMNYESEEVNVLWQTTNPN